MTSSLRAGEAAPVDVRAVGEERQHALGAELREPMDVEVLAVERRLVDLEVAGVDDDATACGSPAPRSRACCA